VTVGVDAISKGMRLRLTVGDLRQFIKGREIKYQLRLPVGVDANWKGMRLGLTDGVDTSSKGIRPVTRTQWESMSVRRACDWD